MRCKKIQGGRKWKEKVLLQPRGNPVTLVGSEPKVGDEAPEFTILDADLKEVKSKDFAGKIKLISVTPSLDTPVCDLQATRFNEEAAKLPADVVVLNVSMDLPFAISGFCTVKAMDKIKVFSDHRDASFGISYGVLIKELRLLARSIFIVDKDDIIRYIEIVSELTDHPDHNKAIEMVKKLIIPRERESNRIFEKITFSISIEACFYI